MENDDSTHYCVNKVQYSSRTMFCIMSLSEPASFYSSSAHFPVLSSRSAHTRVVLLSFKWRQQKTNLMLLGAYFRNEVDHLVELVITVERVEITADLLLEKG